MLGRVGTVATGGHFHHGLLLKSGISYNDDIHTAHAQLAPPPFQEKAAHTTIPSAKKYFSIFPIFL